MVSPWLTPSVRSVVVTSGVQILEESNVRCLNSLVGRTDGSQGFLCGLIRPSRAWAVGVVCFFVFGAMYFCVYRLGSLCVLGDFENCGGDIGVCRKTPEFV